MIRSRRIVGPLLVSCRATGTGLALSRSCATTKSRGKWFRTACQPQIRMLGARRAGEHTAPTIGPPRGPAAPVSPAGMSAPASGGTALHRITHASVTLEGKAGGPPRGLDLLASTAGRSRNSRSLANDGGSKPTIASRPGTHPAAGSPCDHNATHAIASPVTGGGMPSLYRPWPRKVLRRASRAFRAPGGEQKSCHPRQDAWFSSTPEATRPVGQVLAPPRKHRAVALARRRKLRDPQAPSGCTVGARAHPSSCQSGTPGDRR